MLRFSLFRKTIHIHSTNLVTGIIFLVIGIYILYLAINNKITSVSPSQSQLIAYLTIIQKKILLLTQSLPDWIALTVLLVVVLLFLKKAKIK